ncbi:MAG: hypothetical protein ACTS6G_02185 [Candidatus Hodgkinia cicadicola]
MLKVPRETSKRKLLSYSAKAHVTETCFAFASNFPPLKVITIAAAVLSNQRRPPMLKTSGGATSDLTCAFSKFHVKIVKRNGKAKFAFW